MDDDEIVHVEPYWYCVGDCLGAGSFGEVYKCHNDQNKSQLLAIKRIRLGRLSQHYIDLEIQILQELSAPDVQHSNFVTLIDCVQTDRHVYLVMEYCNGGDLEHYLRAKKIMNEYSIKLFLRQIASALKILHDHEIVHRDLKPANILLSHNGKNGMPNISDITFKIGDFGVGRFLDNGVQAQTFCGTKVYMAPEIYMPDAKYDYKADLWSLGAIIYQCLTGTLHSAFQKEPIKFPPNTSSALKHLIEGLLARDPEDRMNFNDFYNHPFINMKALDAEKRKTPMSEQLLAAVRASVDYAATSPTVDDCLALNRVGPKFRRTSSFRARFQIKEGLTTELVKSLTVVNRDVYGIAHLDARLYILCRSPNVLAMYSDQDPFIKIKDVYIAAYIQYPQDVAGCRHSRCLYVTDIGDNSIWKVESGFSPKMSLWVSDISAPHTLSVSRDGRVVTFGNESKSVDIYGPNAARLLRVPLPGDVKQPQHAVETGKGTVVVGFGDVESAKHGVCEISSKGELICVYNHNIVQLKHPTHLAIDADDRVYVADSAADRIIQLDSDLNLEQVLPTDGKDRMDKPFRLCITSVKGQKRLIVENKKNSVEIFSILDQS